MDFIEGETLDAIMERTKKPVAVDFALLIAYLLKFPHQPFISVPFYLNSKYRFLQPSSKGEQIARKLVTNAVILNIV